MYYRQALTGSDFSNSGWVVNLKVGLLGIPGQVVKNFLRLLAKLKTTKAWLWVWEGNPLNIFYHEINL